MYERIPTRGTIIVATDSAEELRLADEWFAQFGASLRYRSENTGCGCCIDHWDVEGPEGAIAAIPEMIAAQSDWTNPGPPEPDLPRNDEEASGRQRRRRPRPKWKNR